MATHGVVEGEPFDGAGLPPLGEGSGHVPGEFVHTVLEGVLAGETLGFGIDCVFAYVVPLLASET
jgi:hypothetical protein